LQTISPELSSVIRVVLLQEGHLCSLDDFNYTYSTNQLNIISQLIFWLIVCLFLLMILNY
jgi:hypothetical protein